MTTVQLGLKENWKQFTLLVLINAFVGGMVGLERSILPDLAEHVFHQLATSAILSFIVVFGITKALTNYFTGALANSFGRKNLLLFGWIIAIPIPFIFIYTNHWNWIVFANVLLGINQGLAWSSTVVMKMDLVGEKQRGFAMGLNEFAGYLSVAIFAFISGWLASEYGVRPAPFYIGFVLIGLGLFFTLFFVKDTKHHVSADAATNSTPLLKHVFIDTTFRHRNLSAVTQAGLINNLNDGMVWGILPILLSQLKFSIAEIGTLTAIYPAVWGLGQLVTGKLADRYTKRNLLFIGMFGQAIGLFLLFPATEFWHFLTIGIVLGLGTALVYPTFLAAVAENTHPLDRPKSLGVFRLWRDLGYALGAILTGIIADVWNLPTAILLIAGLTLISSLVILARMQPLHRFAKGE